MRTIILCKKNSDSSSAMAYDFDLGEPVYLGVQYVATIDLNIEGMRKDEAVLALHSHRQIIHRCRTAKEAKFIANTWV